MRRPTTTQVTAALAWVCFLAGLAWAVVLLTALGHIYLTRSVPFGFVEWVVEIQVRGTVSWPVRPHTDAYYLIRFLAFTAVLELLGIWGLVYLRRRANQPTPCLP